MDTHLLSSGELIGHPLTADQSVGVHHRWVSISRPESVGVHCHLRLAVGLRWASTALFGR